MRRRTGLVFVAPALALFAVFVLYPMVTAFSYAFFQWQGTTRGAFAGLENFVTLFTRAPFTTDLPRALLHNVLFFIGTMLIQNTFGLTIAYLLYTRPRSRRMLQTLYAMPYLVSPIVIGYLWTLLLSPTFGPVNTLLTKVGLESWALPWLGDPKTAIRVVILVSVRQAFSKITLPLLVPAIGTVSVLTFIFAMEAFALPYAFGGSTGNPAGATDFVSLLFYRTAFDSGATDAIGSSSALATLLFLIIFGGAYAATAVLRRHERRITA
jgi:raffinose/stachyose/melibiose transport system permease protein